MTRSNPTGIAAGATVLACIAALVAAVLPWLRTGEARRSAFALARSADALGLVDTPLRRAMVVSCYALPLLTAAAWTAAALRRPVVVAVIGGLVGAIGVSAGSIMIASFRPESGPVVAVAAGGAALASAAWLSLTIRGASRIEPSKGRGRA